MDVNRDEFFTVRINHSRLGHRYKLYVPYDTTTARYNYFSYRVSRIWNTLPPDDVDFQAVHRFRNSLTANIMIRRPPRSTQSRSSAASDVNKRQK